MLDSAGRQARTWSEHLVGLDLDFDPSLVETSDVERARAVLRDALKALDAGAQGYLIKPVAIERLLQAISEYVGSEE